MGLLETLTLAGNLDINSRITIVGVQPENTDYSLELSDVVKSRIPDILKQIKDLI